MAVPGVFLDWEYKYFRKNIIEFAEYMHLCDRAYNGRKIDIVEYINAMKKGDNKCEAAQKSIKKQ